MAMSIGRDRNMMLRRIAVISALIATLVTACDDSGSQQSNAPQVSEYERCVADLIARTPYWNEPSLGQQWQADMKRSYCGVP